MKFAMVLVAAVAPLFAQEIKLPPNLERLKDKASEVVDVTLDSSMLQMASRFFSEGDADQAKAKKLVSGLKAIYVRSFEFDKPGEYDPADLEGIRSQLRAPGWSRIVGVKSRKKSEDAEVYLKSENGAISGLAVIALEPRQFTVVNIVGSINPEQLAELSGQFGVPKLEAAKPPKSKQD